MSSRVQIKRDPSGLALSGTIRRLFYSAALILSGCAGITYQAIPNEEADEKATGFRYFDSAPYLVLTKDANGEYNSQLVYLPDKTHKFEARPYNFLSVNGETLKLDKTGVLTDETLDTDSSAVPAAIVKALADVAKSAISTGKLLAFAQPSLVNRPKKVIYERPTVALYKIVKRSGTWGLIGATPIAGDEE